MLSYIKMAHIRSVIEAGTSLFSAISPYVITLPDHSSS